MSALAALLVAAAQAAAATPGAAPAAATPPDSPVTVKATASKAEVTVGEIVTIDVAATGPAGTAYTFPREAEIESFSLRTAAARPGEGEGPTGEPGTHRYEAAVFALGEATFPPIPVRYRLANGTEGVASSQPIELKVVSLLPKDPRERKLADIRGPLPVGVGRAFWVGLVVALGLAAALVVWLVQRRRRREAPRSAPAQELPAGAEALRAVEALAASGLLARGEYRPFYIRLTAAAKRYLERRLAAPVLEMTTAETLAFLRGHPHGGDLLPVVRDLAEAADRVKFARGQGLAEEAERHLAAVRALVHALETKLRPVASDAAPEGRAA